MKKSPAIRIILLALLVVCIAATAGCGDLATGGASVGKTTITLKPSNATLVISPDGTSFSGVKSDQVEVQWQTTESAK